MMKIFFMTINRGLGSRERKPMFFRGKETVDQLRLFTRKPRLINHEGRSSGLFLCTFPALKGPVVFLQRRLISWHLKLTATGIAPDSHRLPFSSSVVGGGTIRRAKLCVINQITKSNYVQRE
jgi:hypothetical protein